MKGKFNLKNSQLKAVDMGSHIMMDFQNLDPQVNLSDYYYFQQVIENGLKKTDCNICDKKVQEFSEEKGFTLMYLLSESHISVHTWPKLGCFTLDFYNCGENSWKNLQAMEEHLISTFGEKCLKNSILIPRGKDFARNIQFSYTKDDEEVILQEDSGTLNETEIEYFDMESKLKLQKVIRVKMNEDKNKLAIQDIGIS